MKPKTDMKTFATKEEKKAYYKARQQKENARQEAAEMKDRYDVAGNPLNLPAEFLGRAFAVEMNAPKHSFASMLNDAGTWAFMSYLRRTYDKWNNPLLDTILRTWVEALTEEQVMEMLNTYGQHYRRSLVLKGEWNKVGTRFTAHE